MKRFTIAANSRLIGSMLNKNFKSTCLLTAKAGVGDVSITCVLTEELGDT